MLIPLERVGLDRGRNRAGNCGVSFLTTLLHIWAARALQTSSRLELRPVLAECEMRHSLVRQPDSVVIFGQTGFIGVMKTQRLSDIIGSLPWSILTTSQL